MPAAYMSRPKRNVEEFAMGAVQRKRADGKITVEEYLAFIEARPEEERWQLIDGVAMLMNPPTIRHQGIAANLAFELNAHFRQSARPLKAYQEVGLIVPDVDMFRPEADVAVLDGSADLDTSWADRFYFVAEVLSESNTDKDIAFKRASYIAHPDNLYCLVIEQTAVHVDVYARAASWERIALNSADAVLDLPAFGFRLRVGELYRDTPLWTPGADSSS